LVESICLY